ncbi:unnamed protein product [Rotaria socialis]|uniref:Uncharacterized protein n=1 Tax=Rotaria socialis TaxID=392032 RepID=A0A818ZC59_9BILA|nr:unnamed protein product [Rotaria socialis]CAF4192151.1 unnamed protein product [Rotaria socialis]CAF4491031.1 unnamed protein product [Rotaria socialis]
MASSICSFLGVDIINFGGIFSNAYQVLDPPSGYSAWNFNEVEPTFHVVLYNLVNDAHHILANSIETGQWVLKQIENNLLCNFAYSTKLNTFNDRWDLFLPIQNYPDSLAWAFFIDQQTMYFISKQNVTLVDLSSKSSFY